MLSWFARNHVAANLLFFVLILVGMMSVLSTKLEVFPEIDTGLITVEVPYPGATPQEVEEGVLLRVEEAVAEVEGIKETRGTAAESVGIVSLELETWADETQVRDDVKNAIDRIDTFPEDTEEPVVSDVTQRMEVLIVALHGEVPRKSLKELGERIKSEFIATGIISSVEIGGVPPYEVGIEIDEATLRAHGLTFADIADAVRRGSLDLPAGSVETDDAEVLIRTLNQAKDRDAFERIVVRQLDDGTVLTVGDLAFVRDEFEDSDYAVRYKGDPAVLLSVYRVGDEGALNIASTVKKYVEENADNLPAGVSASIYNDFSIILTERISLMLKNAGLGLILVVIFLGLFLDPKLAFWCAAGLFMSFVAAIAVLPIMDVSINMISLFAFILVLGIVVDDAIVVGENIYEHLERGESAARAAVLGVREVALPVTLTIISTVIAFSPLLFGEGDIGQILRVIPVVVIAVLVISLVEALLILPAHLSDATPPHLRKQTWFVRFRGKLADGLAWFTNVPYKAALHTATRWRYVTLAVAAFVFMVTMGYVAGGWLPWKFFPEVDADFTRASLEMPPGTTAQRTAELLDRVEEAAEKIPTIVGWEGEEPLIKSIQVTVGGTPMAAAMDQGNLAAGLQNPAIGEVIVQLIEPSKRDISTSDITRAWRDEIGTLPGARSLKFADSLVSAGDPINVQLSPADGSDEAFDRLLSATQQLKRELNQLEGVRSISDSFQQGKPQLDITGLTPTGKSLGLTISDVAAQVRGAFFGAEAQRFQRERDEVRVYVRYPKDQRRSLADIEELYIRLPDGTAAPLSTVAEYELGEGFSQISRVERQRIVNVTADVDTTLANAAELNTLLREEVLPQVVADNPGTRWSMKGEQEEQRESMNSLLLSLGVAMVGIYGLLAILFRSYIQPVIVMSAIPFGLVGAIWGHILFDFFRPMPLNFLSMFGVVALTGVVVNDSLILIDLINRKRIQGADAVTATLEGGLRRCRPILLTTFTTFFGLAPMILETSLQAQFLIPMALSLGFGVLVATFITLLLVPALYLTIEDIRELLRPLLGKMVLYTPPEMDEKETREFAPA
ncbi:MAG: efflux RND transporter permease subunit [Planctomycetota bacterium]